MKDSGAWPRILIEIEGSASITRLVFDKRNVPAELKPLVDWLAAKAQYIKR
jgi:hypothetical protein